MDDPGAAARILLAHAIILGFGGVPVLWMGAELGLLNDAGWADDAAHADDNRWVHRPRMPWSVGTGSVEPDQRGINAGLRDLIDVRRGLPQLHAAVPTEIWDPRDPGVLLVVRRHPAGPLLGAYNVTDQERWVAADVLAWLGLHTPGLSDAISDRAPELRDGAVPLAPYAAAWLIDTDRP